MNGTIEIALDGEEVSVPAMIFPETGIAVHKAHYGYGWSNDEWSITHVRSGLNLCHANNPETAARVVLELATTGDWTRPASDITADEKRALVQVVADAGEGCWFNPRPCNDPEVLNR